MFRKFQTYYLLLAAVCILMMYLFPIAQIKTEKGIFDLNTNGITIQMHDVIVVSKVFVIQILIPLTSFVLLSSVFIFKQNKYQKSMGRLSYILILLLLFFCWFELYQITDILKEFDITKGYRGFYFPVAALAFVFLANRAIKQEEKIEKLLDKLRKK